MKLYWVHLYKTPRTLPGTWQALHVLVFIINSFLRCHCEVTPMASELLREMKAWGNKAVDCPVSDTCCCWDTAWVLGEQGALH